jgi:hypothetical protein
LFRLKRELATQQQICEAEKQSLRKTLKELEDYFDTLNQPSAATNAKTKKLEAEIKKLKDRLRKIEADLKEEAGRAKYFKVAMDEHYASLEKQRLATEKCNEKLAAFRAQYAGSSLGLGAEPAGPDDEAEPIDCLKCWAEVAKLKFEIAKLEVERTPLRKQLEVQEQINAEGADDGDDKGTEAHYPLGFNDFYPHNGACNDEIEALNNQITSQKQVIGAMEQQAALDKLEIDALKGSNTDKSKAYQKFVALIEKLRGELEDLHAKLAECKFRALPFIAQKLICL